MNPLGVFVTELDSPEFEDKSEMSSGIRFFPLLFIVFVHILSLGLVHTHDTYRILVLN